MLADLSRADVMLVGEQHDDPNTHRLETALLEGLLRRRAALVVSLEMFERDVQPALDALSRRPEHGGGVPEGEPAMAALRDRLPPARRVGQVADLAGDRRQRAAPRGVRHRQERARSAWPRCRRLNGRSSRPTCSARRTRISIALPRRWGTIRAARRAGHRTRADQQAMIERYYQSQCAKDETMAESIAASFARRGSATGPIVHFTGAFHSDFGTGTAERVRRRLPGRRVAIVTLVPLPRSTASRPSADDLKRAEYLIYTIK